MKISTNISTFISDKLDRMLKWILDSRKIINLLFYLIIYLAILYDFAFVNKINLPYTMFVSFIGVAFGIIYSNTINEK